MDAAVVRLPEEAPIVWMNEFEKDPIGKVTNIYLEDGEITGEAEWFGEQWSDQAVSDLKCRLGGFYSNVTHNEGRVVLAELKACSLVTEAQMPGEQ